MISLSCANESKHSKSDGSQFEMTEEPNLEITLDESKEFNFETLASQKLQEYFDLIRLLKLHPEFKEDILLQLHNFSPDNSEQENYLDADSIYNIRQVDKAIIISDSVQKLKLYFDTTSANNIKKDSFYAVITTKEIMLDNLSTLSTKMKFQKIKD